MKIKKQKGFVIILVGVVITLLVLISIPTMMYISAVNYGAKQEALLEASYDQSRNVLTQYNKKILESVQVPEMYKEDLLKLTEATMSGRYGAGGSKAMFQFIQEQNPTLDPSIYKQIQQIIESGRNDFEKSQTQMIDIKRSYLTILNSFPKGFFMKLAGFPKIPLDKYSVITSDYTDKIFDTKKDNTTIKLRKEK